MTIAMLVRFLIGSRQAICHISQNRRSLWVGLIFVLSAGFAREYDGEDLLRQPWHLLIPLVASIVSSLVLFGLVKLVFARWEEQGLSGPNYLDFLSCYWMTAPLAWLYAIPVERHMSAADSVRFNLVFLAIVAGWRVLLITRVISVLFARNFISVFFVVLFFADTLVVIVMCMTPLPIISFMGGIRLTESEAILQNVACQVQFFGIISWPIWLVITLVMLVQRLRADLKKRGDDKPLRKSTESPSEPVIRDRRVSWGIWILAVLSLLGWSAILPITQPEQQRRMDAEQMLRNDRVEDALTYMSSLSRKDFPPHWDPPPRIGYGEHEPPIWRALLVSAEPGIASWVRQLYVDKLVAQAQQGERFSDYPFLDERPFKVEEIDDEQLARYVQMITDIEEGYLIAKYHSFEAKTELGLRNLDPSTQQEIKSELSASRRASLEKIVELANQLDD